MTAKTFSKDVVITEIDLFLKKFPRIKFSYTVLSNSAGKIIQITSKDNSIQKYAKELGLN